MHVFLNVTGLPEDPPVVRHSMHTAELIAEMIQSTGESFNVPTKAILSKRRTARVSLARHVSMWLVRTNTSLSLVEIGDAFGGRDHGTVIHACRNVAEWIRQGGEIAVSIECLNRQFSNKQNNAKPEHSNAHGQFDP